MITCKRPYVLAPKGVAPTDLTDYNARLAVTPFRCGQCMPCMLYRSGVWKHRIELESKTHPATTFYSPTYEDEYLSLTDDGLPTLDPRDHVLFMMKLRKRLKEQGRNVRFFAVGEYGSKNFRPHMHYMLFGIHPKEKPLLDKCWTYDRKPMGYSTVGEITPERAGYITGYVSKKLTNRHDERLDGRKPEFARMSLRKGLGHEYIVKMAKDLKKNYKNVDFEEIPYLNYGKKKRPIGSYLAKVLLNELAKDEDDLRRMYDEKLLRFTVGQLLDIEHTIPYNSGFYQRVLENCNTAKVRNMEIRHENYNVNKEFERTEP